MPSVILSFLGGGGERRGNAVTGNYGTGKRKEQGGVRSLLKNTVMKSS